MLELSLLELASGLANKRFSSVELTQFYLNRLEAFNPQLNAFITVTDQQAMEQARRADQRLHQDQANILTGIPLAHKDIFCTDGVKTTCGSRMLENFIAPYNATVVQKLDEQGAVMLGKTNMDEFAMGSSNENSYYGAVKNPWNPRCVPGGSSGGSAAAVAAGLVPVASGTDTGGSVRQPAALTGITGLKPTYGRVSRHGMIAFASSLDQAGVLSRSAEDAAVVLEAIAGFDAKDSTSSEQPVDALRKSLNTPVENLKLGVPKQFFNASLDASVREVVEKALEEYQELGATLIEIDLPNIELSVPTYYVVAPAECSSNLSRFDGVRFGYRCEDPKDLNDLYCRSRSEAFGPEVTRRILTGTFVLSAGFYDAYYLKAQKIRHLIDADFQAAFDQVDFIVSPTAPSPAFELGAHNEDPLSMYLNDIFTIGVSLAGLPAMSVPCGFVNDLPIGLQLIGKHFDEARLLATGHQYQQQTQWHTLRPAAFSKTSSHAQVGDV